jgi:hypothetical protein
MMTEDEAKTKWCPMVRFVPSTEDHRAITNRVDVLVPDDSKSIALCIGSACMAWQWGNKKLGHDLTGEEGKRFHRDNPLMGYCGAFGKPAT